MKDCNNFIEKASQVDEYVAGPHIDNKIEKCIKNKKELGEILKIYGNRKPDINTEFKNNTFTARSALRIQNTNYNKIHNTPKTRWYEIPLSDCFLNDDNIINTDNKSIISGRLFSTAIPRSIIYAPTNLSEFIERTRLSKLDIIVPLTNRVEIIEYTGIGELKELYKGIGLQCYPIEIDDFEIPSIQSSTKNKNRDKPNYNRGEVQYKSFYKNILYLVGQILNGKNILVHCIGGTGRTGLVLSSIIKILGITDPISHIRKYGKSTYVETYRQITYINRLKLPLTSHFFEYITNNKFIIFRIYKHLKTHTKANKNNSYGLQSKYKRFSKMKRQDIWNDLTHDLISDYELDFKQIQRFLKFIDNIQLENLSKFYNLDFKNISKRLKILKVKRLKILKVKRLKILKVKRLKILKVKRLKILKVIKKNLI